MNPLHVPPLTALPALVLLVALLLPRAAGAELDAFAGLTSVTWDAHSHTANTATFNLIDDDNPSQGAHSHGWCAAMADLWHAAGIQVTVQSHHSDNLQSASGLADWKARGDAGFTDQHGDFYPTHSQGLPLLVSGGHTEDEVRALWECAEARSDGATKLSLYGIEYTVSTQAQCGAAPGTETCGGHKIAIFAANPGISCTDNAPSPGSCADEGELYDLLSQVGGVLGAAHPGWAGTLPTEWEPYDPSTARGGMWSEVVGFELGGNARWEHEPCQGPNQSWGCGYRQVLARGYHVAPWFGSDLHHCPDPAPSACNGPRSLIGQSHRGVCQVTALTRTAMLDALAARRCAYAWSGQPDVQFTLEGARMGEVVGKQGPLDYEIYVSMPSAATSVWEIGCGRVTGSGDGGYAIRASGPCAEGVCEAAGSFPDASDEWCYLRTHQGGVARVVSAPVRLQTPIPSLGGGSGVQVLAYALALLLPIALLRARQR